MGTPGPNDPDTAFEPSSGADLSAITATVDAARPLAIYGGDPINPLLAVETGANQDGDPVNGLDLYLRSALNNLDAWAWPNQAGLSANGTDGYISVNAGDTGQRLSMTLTGSQAMNAIEALIDSVTAFAVKPDGDMEMGTHGGGIILASPNGTRYRVTVADDGTVTSTAV